DPVNKHLDWFDIEQQFERSGPVTIEGLLTHSSGLPREASFDYWRNDLDFPTREQLINTVGEQETLYPAHRYFQYSNLGFTLAGEIIQALSGQDYADYMQANVLDPLGLTDTRSYYPEELRGHQLAIGYDGLVRDRGRVPTEAFFTKAITPAAGYTSSVNDLAKFIIWQFGLLDGLQESVLNQHTLQEMHRVHWVNPDWSTSWGLGFVARRQGDRTLAGHTGSCPGYQTNFSMDVDKRLGVIVLTNAGDGQPARLVDNIISTLRPELDKPAPVAETEIPDFSAFEANFSNQHWGGETAVRQWGDELVSIGIPSRSLNVQKLQHDQDNQFHRENAIGLQSAVISFEADASGKTTRMKVNDSYSYRIE
ncbi:MAG: serine hydrolase domain-containing protein, partial [Gammaproteobacteria bacterium]|nr:serine hydrolase domain-containing protein [Gammaproteobacteria bacterium]